MREPQQEVSLPHFVWQASHNFLIPGYMVTLLPPTIFMSGFVAVTKINKNPLCSI
jgi:hypothetical protein